MWNSFKIKFFVVKVQYPEEDYFRGGYYGREQQDNENKIKIALDRLEHGELL